MCGFFFREGRVGMDLKRVEFESGLNLKMVE